MNWQVGIEVGSVAQSIIPPTKPLPIGWPRNAPRLEVLQAIVAGYVGYSEATFGTGERQTVNDDNEEHSIGSAHVRAGAGAENGRREQMKSILSGVLT
jgi:hypothetical protein